ncbi:MAG: hypothetical protein J07HN4v3_01070 [Halonotius sp. J07HN4]|nr:MAG: hypothetical protein J07HN4v3_01070 [Halonotius sp. J07HN4]
MGMWGLLNVENTVSKSEPIGKTTIDKKPKVEQIALEVREQDKTDQIIPK